MASREKLDPASVSMALEGLAGWSADGNSSISKSFTFDTHITAMGFVVKVAMAAEVMDHHPDLRIVYNKVEITLSTHDAGGVTALDMELAGKIEKAL
jgi:4a-hydroxytetrahydrobiopterin dehydratase